MTIPYTMKLAFVNDNVKIWEVEAETGFKGSILSYDDGTICTNTPNNDYFGVTNSHDNLDTALRFVESSMTLLEQDKQSQRYYKRQQRVNY